jgi:predicted SnoaL-like aldol condensation-catalyzing enzyme
MEEGTSMSETLETNKKAVLESYDLALNKKDADAAFKYLGPTYTQHNPTVADGFEGWRAMVSWIKAERPNFRAEVKRVIAEGDLVVLHSHMTIDADDRGRAAIDIFRLENGKIVEHWDILQPIPETSANNNTMF